MSKTCIFTSFPTFGTKLGVPSQLVADMHVFIGVIISPSFHLLLSCAVVSFIGFHTRKLLHKALTPRNFYTDMFYTWKLHRRSKQDLIHRSFFTDPVWHMFTFALYQLRTGLFIQASFCAETLVSTEMLLCQGAFTQMLFTHRSFYAQSVSHTQALTEQLLHTFFHIETFTQSSV